MQKPLYGYYDNEHPSIATPRLKKALTSLVGICDYIYVGRTNNAEARFNAHQRSLAPGDKQWDEMSVVYGTKWLGNSVEVENALIKHTQRENFKNVRWNDKGTQWDGPQDFAVYLLADATGRRKPLPNKDATQPDDMVSGHYNTSLKSKLCRLVDRCAKSQKRIYVGITNDADRRFGEHQREWVTPWDDLVILYRTSSLDYAAAAETDLIAYAREEYPSACQNTTSGMLPLDYEPYFYVYFLLDKNV